MKDIKTSHAVAFIVGFGFIAGFLNALQSTDTHDRAATPAPIQTMGQQVASQILPAHLPAMPVQTVGQQASPQMVAPQPVAPVPVPTVIWPGGVTPTKTITIPDPAHPMTGIMDTTLGPGEDLEISCEPYWDFSTQSSFKTIEGLIDEGDGFKTQEQIVYRRGQVLAGQGRPWMLKRRIYRFRLKPGSTQAVAIRLNIYKRDEADCKPH